MFAMPTFTASANTTIAKPEVVIFHVAAQVEKKLQRRHQRFQGRSLHWHRNPSSVTYHYAAITNVTVEACVCVCVCVCVC